MPELPRTHLALYALAALLVIGLGWRQLAAGDASRTPAQPAPIHVEREAAGGVLVHVAGAVRNPGVYRLAGAARVDDAVRRAGGATRGADLSAVNLAAKIEDGRQILVPARASRATAVGGAATAAADAPLDLNSATLEQLDTLDGIGPAMAQRIIDHREANGGFSSVEELAQVPGIGPKRLEAIRERVRV